MWWYGAPEGADIEDRALWRAVNPARPCRMDFLERQFASPARVARASSAAST